jgi:hypothetical protein
MNVSRKTDNHRRERRIAGQGLLNRQTFAGGELARQIAVDGFRIQREGRRKIGHW